MLISRSCAISNARFKQAHFKAMISHLIVLPPFEIITNAHPFPCHDNSPTNPFLDGLAGIRKAPNIVLPRNRKCRQLIVQFHDAHGFSEPTTGSLRSSTQIRG